MRIWGAIFVMCFATSAMADEVTVAVATNFAAPIEAISKEFETETGHRLRIVTGSSGKLFAQIVAGAPFDVFLSADQSRPAQLHQDGLAGPTFTYAVGQLVLWAPKAEAGFDGLATLEAGAFDHLAIANPDLAPYGLAARQSLGFFGLSDAITPKLVYGQNVGQAFAMVATGNAELGLVAASSVISQSGGIWPIPPAAHDPISQDGVQLSDTPATAAFVTYLLGAQAREIIARFGYRLPND